MWAFETIFQLIADILVIYKKWFIALNKNLWLLEIDVVMRLIGTLF